MLSGKTPSVRNMLRDIAQIDRLRWFSALSQDEITFLSSLMFRFDTLDCGTYKASDDDDVTSDELMQLQRIYKKLDL